MRFFKHGDAFAITLPDTLRARAGVREDEDYEFLMMEPGVFVLVSKSALEQRVRSSLVAQLGARLNGQPVPAATRTIVPTPVPAAAGAETPERAPAIPGRALPLTPDTVRETLFRQGFLVLENENLMKSLSPPLEKDVKEGKVIGVRGFDKKFYIVSSEYYSRLAPAVSGALAQGEQATAEIAKRCKTTDTGCLAILQVMKDFGEVIEKKRGVYMRVA